MNGEFINESIGWRFFRTRHTLRHSKRFPLSFVRKCQLQLLRELTQAWDTHKCQVSEGIWESGAADALSQEQMDCKGCPEQFRKCGAFS